MLRGRAEVQAREASAGKRRPTGRVSRDTVDKAKREREALDQAEAARLEWRSLIARLGNDDRVIMMLGFRPSAAEENFPLSDK